MKKIIFVSILIVTLFCSCSATALGDFFTKMGRNAYVDLGIYTPDLSAAEDLADLVGDVEYKPQTEEEKANGEIPVLELSDGKKDELKDTLDEVTKSQANKEAFVEEMSKPVVDTDLKAAVKATYEKVEADVESAKNDGSGLFNQDQNDALDNAKSMLDSLANKEEITQADVLQAQLLSDAIKSVSELANPTAGTDIEAVKAEIINDANTILVTASVLAGEDDTLNDLIGTLSSLLTSSAKGSKAFNIPNNLIQSIPSIFNSIMYNSKGEVDLDNKLTYLYSILLAYENAAVAGATSENFTGYKVAGLVDYSLATIFTTISDIDKLIKAYSTEVLGKEISFVTAITERDTANKNILDLFISKNQGLFTAENPTWNSIDFNLGTDVEIAKFINIIKQIIVIYDYSSDGELKVESIDTIKELIVNDDPDDLITSVDQVTDAQIETKVDELVTAFNIDKYATLSKNIATRSVTISEIVTHVYPDFPNAYKEGGMGELSNLKDTIEEFMKIKEWKEIV